MLPPIEQRFSAIDECLAYLTVYKKMPQAEFFAYPKHFGGATRFIQLIAKYCLEIAAQVPDQKIQPITTLSNFYLEPTLTKLHVNDVYAMLMEIDKTVSDFRAQVEKWT
jgi:hypothetical protein